jgi:DNA-binding transcriptional MerR regulator
MKRIYFTTKAASERLQLSPRTLEKWRCTGGGPSYRKFGGKVLYEEQDLDRWEASRLRRSTSDDGSINSRATTTREEFK